MKELKSLNKFLLRYKWRLMLGFFFIICANWFNLYPAQIFRNAIDIVVETINSYKIFEGSKLQSEIYTNLAKALLLFAALLFTVALIKGVFTFFMRYTIIMVSRFIEFDLKNEIYNHYQKLDISFYKENKTGDIMNRIGDDVSKVRMYLGPSIMYLINLIVLFALVITTMININPELSLYILLPLPFLSVTIYYVSRLINIKSERVQKQLSKLFNLSQETFAGIRVIKAYNKSNSTIKKFNQEAENYRSIAMNLATTESLFYPVILFLPVLSTLITIYVGGLEVIKGTITYGNIGEFVIYINLLTWPVASLGWVTSIIQRAAASQKRINEFLLIQPKIKNNSNNPLEIKGAIEFKNVKFTYPESKVEALKNISFKVEPGKTLAIVGKTGSGKSTIVQLLNRLYDCSKGTILIDDKPIQSINLNDLRNQTGCVPQDVFLFSDTVGNNISFGTFGNDIKSNKEKIKWAAEQAVVHENIIEFNEGYDTIVGERGVTLSGGQKQRISIARAVLKNPKILIFDDCLSAVDTKTEEKILRNLKQIMINKTTIIVSHRISSIQHADHIIMIDNGEIIEEGNHNELIQLNKEYESLYKKQLIED
ncbi:MAG: ABC transporter [Flavobacteriales bacterium]|nr:ABC transporter [Flavobacteriales bacterium]